MKHLSIIFLIYCVFSVCAFGQNYNLLKDAKALGGDCYRLTAATGYQTGVVWYQDKLNLSESFDIEFLMNFGTNDASGADGIAFIMQTVGNQAIGATGGGLGFAGFSPSLGIEFDTWSNSSEFSSSGDPSSDHIAILQNGNIFHLTPDNLAGPIQASASNVNIEDGKDHVVRIVWRPTTNTVEVYFDCQLRLTLKKDIIKDIFKGKSEVWWGFGAATGGGVNNQTVCLKKEILFKNEIKNSCPNQSVQLISRVASDDIYKWTPAIGLDNPNSRTPIAKPQVSTTYTVNYRNNCGLPITDTVRVEVVPLPEINWGDSKEICNGKSVELLPILSPNNLPITYKWSTGATTPTISVTQSGTYELTVTNGACSTKSSVTVASGKPPVLRSDETVCLNSSAQLLEAGAMGQNLSYLWTPTNATSATLNVSQIGKYQVRVTSPEGCESTRTIDVLAAPQLELGSNKTVCDGESISLIPTINAIGGVLYRWNTGATSSSINVNQSGIYKLTIFQASCFAIDSVEVRVNPVPMVLSDEKTCQDRPLTATGISADLTYFWEHSGERSRAISVSQDGVYKVKITNQFGCSKTRTFTVEGPCSASILAPDIFTPNGDGVNETFKPIIVGGVLLQLMIYDRWGNIIFSDESDTPEWDGRLRGQVLNGVFAYRLDYRTFISNEKSVYRGKIQILR